VFPFRPLLSSVRLHSHDSVWSIKLCGVVHHVVLENAAFRRPSMCQKRPSVCQKRPSVCQKRPSMCQKRPSVCQKRPSMCQKRPSVCQKRPSVCQKRPSMCLVCVLENAAFRLNPKP